MSGKSGTVSFETIVESFLSAGIVRFKKDLILMFNIKGADAEITFDHFLETLAVSVISRKIAVHKLDSFVDSQNNLAPDTLLSQERRMLLMEHIVDRPAVRAWGVDVTWAEAEKKASSSQHRFTRNRISLEKVEKSHEMERSKATEIVKQLDGVVSKLSTDARNSASEHSPQPHSDLQTSPADTRFPAILPLDAMLSPKLLEYCGEKMSLDTIDSVTRTSDTGVSNVTTVTNLTGGNSLDYMQKGSICEEDENVAPDMTKMSSRAKILAPITRVMSRGSIVLRKIGSFKVPKTVNVPRFSTNPRRRSTMTHKRKKGNEDDKGKSPRPQTSNDKVMKVTTKV
eukprot:CAMPEP_0185036854 /NCGR_PEP_ID=MMETSP1103-20130426/30443_1 /TAXON_ID=36769 /ORGANISM="Paraphysomonas bandaiensis, Strain Caron Lab Isolate" /LENGTH=340 /DNA_ID=CAMNT_0027574575 /DNA_START=292 /DNA_END=1314 /DNA_ORIENTATION=-